MSTIYMFDANYGRKGKVAITRRKCMMCKRNSSCLVVDQSENEYFPFVACQDCIDEAFEFHNKRGDRRISNASQCIVNNEILPFFEPEEPK